MIDAKTETRTPEIRENGTNQILFSRIKDQATAFRLYNTGLRLVALINSHNRRKLMSGVPTYQGMVTDKNADFLASPELSRLCYFRYDRGSNLSGDSLIFIVFSPREIKAKLEEDDLSLDPCYIGFSITKRGTDCSPAFIFTNSDNLAAQQDDFLPTLADRFFTSLEPYIRPEDLSAGKINFVGSRLFMQYDKEESYITRTVASLYQEIPRQEQT